MTPPERDPSSALFDTSLVLDYFRGVRPADAAFERFAYRAITVTTWLEVMGAAPRSVAARTRDFLRHFERLPITEAVADRALVLMQQHTRVSLRHALPWATAQVNALVYVTANFPKLELNDDGLWIAYRAKGSGRSSRRPR